MSSVRYKCSCGAEFVTFAYPANRLCPFATGIDSGKVKGKIEPAPD